MTSPKKRVLLACVVAVVWMGWAVWANLPHHYDIHALRQEIDLQMPNAVVEPASAGFPFAYMRYEYSPTGQFLPTDFSPSAVVPNALLCLIGSAGAILLVLRTRRLSISFVAILCMTLAPALALAVLVNGLHPDVITYLYLTPVALLLFSFMLGKWQNPEMHRSSAGDSILLAASIARTR